MHVRVGAYYSAGRISRSSGTPARVDEIIAIDFTDYDYHTALDKAYNKLSLLMLANSIEMNLLVSDIQWSLPNTSVLSQATFINQLLETVDRPSIEVAGRTYHYKPLHIPRPKNLESMTVSLKDVTAQKDYFRLGQEEAEQLFASMPG